MLFGVTGIAAKEFVPAVTTQHSGQAVSFSHLCTIEGRYSRSIAKRLVENGCDVGDSVYDVIGCNVILVVMGGKMPCRDARILHFVVARCVETDGVGVRWTVAHLSQYSRNGGAVCAATEEGSSWLIAYRVAHTGAQYSHKILLEVLKRALLIFHELHLPIFANLELSLPIKEVFAGQETFLALVN